jgi:predicted MFS family arabinose efflux permease
MTKATGGALLKHRDFRRLWAGETVSELGTQVSILAVPLLAVRSLHASTFQVALLTATSTLGFLVAGLPAGAWVDRLRRRKVMIAADLGRVLALGSIPIAYAFGALGLLQLYLATLAAGLLTVFFDVAYQSYLPSLVGPDHVVEGNAKLGGSAEVAQLAGPSLAGGLVQVIGGSYAIAVDAASFLFSAGYVKSIRKEEDDPSEHEKGIANLGREIGEGLRFVVKQPVIRAITATSTAFNLFSGVMTAVEVVFLVRVVHAQPDVIGFSFAAIGAGGLAGALFASRLSRRFGGARATMGGALLSILGFLIPLATPGVGVLFFAGGYAGSAFGTSLYNINQLSFRQRLCPPNLLGRMNATIRFVVSGVSPVGALAGGLIGTEIGLRPTMWVAAAGQFAAAGLLLVSPVRKLRDFSGTSNAEEVVPQSGSERIA